MTEPRELDTGGFGLNAKFNFATKVSSMARARERREQASKEASKREGEGDARVGREEGQAEGGREPGREGVIEGNGREGEQPRLATRRGERGE